jgi:peptide/nickel transport system substrate-binding protein
VPTLTPEPGPTSTPGPSVTLRIGWLGGPQALDPSPDHPGKADLVLGLIYDRLIYRKLDSTYAPALAKSWSSPDGGKTWVLELQPDVKTHDGQPFDSQDVSFALHLYQNNAGFQYHAGYTATVQSIEASGPNRVTVGMSQPVNNIEAYLQWIPLVPKRAYESGEFGSGVRIGTGPFALQAFVPGQVITLTANTSYWMGAPRVSSLVFRSYGSADALVDALKAGEVDVITDVPPNSIAALKTDPSVQVVTGPQVHFRNLLFNVSSRPGSSGHLALKDKQVRLAIASAIDKQQLIDLALAGRGTPGLTIIPPVLGKWFNPGLQADEFELAKADQVLQNAGYKDTNNDGVRETPGGKSLKLRLFIASEDATGSQEASMITNWLGLVGIQVTTLVMDRAALSKACCPAFDYDLILWERDGSADPGFLLSTLTSPQIETCINQTGYSNPLYDSLYQQQANASGADQRKPIVWQMQQIALEDRPCVVLYYDLAVQAFRQDRFRNWLFVPNGVLSLLDPRSLLQVEPVPGS